MPGERFWENFFLHYREVGDETFARVFPGFAQGRAPSPCDLLAHDISLIDVTQPFEALRTRRWTDRQRRVLNDLERWLSEPTLYTAIAMDLGRTVFLVHTDRVSSVHRCPS